MDYTRSYRGYHNPGYEYSAGEIVFYNYKLYQAVAEVPTDPFENNPSLWQEVSDANIQCFVPKQIVTLEYDNDVTADGSTTILLGESVESVFANDAFGYDFDLTTNGSKLVVSAPRSDNINYDNYKGPYRTDLAYNLGDIVYYQGQYWSCEGLIEDSSQGDSALADSTLDLTPAGPFIESKWHPLDLRVVDKGKIFVYSFNGTNFDLDSVISGKDLDLTQEVRLGESISLSNDGNSLAIGAGLYDGEKIDQGAVFVLTANANSYSLHQTITRKYAEVAEKFGHVVEFLNNDTSLVIFSKNGDNNVVTTFDNLATSFDESTNAIVDGFIDSGRIDIYDKYINNYIFGETLSLHIEIAKNEYGSIIQTARNSIFVSSPSATYDQNTNGGSVVIYSKDNNKYSWMKKLEQVGFFRKNGTMTSKNCMMVFFLLNLSFCKFINVDMNSNRT
jgi:hypothetical protein